MTETINNAQHVHSWFGRNIWPREVNRRLRVLNTRSFSKHDYETITTAGKTHYLPHCSCIHVRWYLENNTNVRTECINHVIVTWASADLLMRFAGRVRKWRAFAWLFNYSRLFKDIFKDILFTSANANSFTFTFKWMNFSIILTLRGAVFEDIK